MCYSSNVFRLYSLRQNKFLAFRGGLMKKTRSFTLLIFAIILTGTLAGGFYGRKVQATPPGGEQVRATDIENSFSEALNIVETNYVDDIKHENLTKASIQNMLRTLDPHSNFFDSKEFQELQSEQHSQFFGIGVTINRRNNRVFILSAIKGTPAEQAGLRYGDAILKVNGKTAIDWSTQEVLEQVRGPKGETVEIEVERAGVPKPLTFKIVRDAVPLPSIRNTYMIKPTVGYIALVGGFNHTTEDELLQAMESLKSQGMKSMVLDLRNNPGGLLTQAIKVSNIFLQKGQSIVSIKGRDKSSESRSHDASNPSPEDIPLVILINRSTASASEIVAGAIQDHDRGIIVGDSSFGKGLVQTVFRLPYGSGLTLTTAKYYTPSGRLIQRDYSGLSFYEYYTRHFKKDGSKEPVGEKHRTDAGRDVYSGGGIKPDVEVKLSEFTVVKTKLFNATFAFARELTTGLVAGQSQFKINRTVFGHKLTEDEYLINEKVIAAFQSFIADKPDFKVSDAQLNENLDYVKRRIREEVVTAAYGAEVGTQVLLEGDEQALKAISELPNAKQLAEARYKK